MQSAAYFYQSNSRKLLKEVADSELILVKEIGKGREQLSADYDIALIKPRAKLVTVVGWLGVKFYPKPRLCMHTAEKGNYPDLFFDTISPSSL